MYLEIVKKYKALNKDVASKTWVLQLKKWNDYITNINNKRKVEPPAQKFLPLNPLIYC
jgi:hypothetical protein